MAALGADYALFVVGLAFASQSTILPAFAAHLGAPNVVIGAIPAVMTLGWFLPSLFAAGHTESLARKLPFILRYTVWERVPFIGLALAAFFLADRAPAAALGVMLLMLLIVTGVGGVLMPAWMDVIGRVIPVTLRGRFFAFANLAASVGGLGGSVATASILAAVPAPASYGVCFVCTTVFMALSYAALVAVREPASTESAPATPLSRISRADPRAPRPRSEPHLVSRRAGVRDGRLDRERASTRCTRSAPGTRPRRRRACSPRSSSWARWRQTRCSAGSPTGGATAW